MRTNVLTMRPTPYALFCGGRALDDSFCVVREWPSFTITCPDEDHGSAMISQLWCGYLQLVIGVDEFESRFYGSATQEPRLRLIVMPWELQQNSMVLVV